MLKGGRVVEDVGFLIAFIGGIASFLAPCIIPLLPTYITTLAGSSIDEVKQDRLVKRRLYLNSLMFILGFSLVFVLLGISATFISRIFLRNQTLFRKIGGIIIIIFGLHLLGVFKISWLLKTKSFNYETKNITAAKAFILGMAFSIGWNPCSSPILSAILIYAGSAQTVWLGGGLLAVYALGLAVPFLLITVFIGYFSEHLHKFNKHLAKVHKVSGILLIIMGILVYNDWLRWFSNLL